MADMVAKGRAPRIKNPHYGDENGMRKHPDRSHFAKVKFVFRGTEQVGAKLTEQAVREIRAAYVPRKTPMASLAAKYGVGISTVYRVTCGRGWAHVK